MSMNFNGTILSDVYFNGIQLDKVYFNGTLVFEKKSTSKRRIMIEDNLAGKTIYSTFTENNIDILPSTTTFEIASKDETDGIVSTAQGVVIMIYDANGNSNQNTIIQYDASTNSLIINNEQNNVSTEYGDFIVGQVSDSALYRHLFIEDENIRPIQVGDDLSGATIYFIVPDNFVKDNIEKNAYESGVYATSANAQISFNSTHQIVDLATGVYGQTMDVNLVCKNESQFIQNARYCTDIYLLDDAASPVVSRNVSKMVLPSNYGIVTDTGESITNSEISEQVRNMIYVDVNTLGQEIYKRRVMIGDNLKNRYIYGDYPSGTNNVVTPDLTFITTSNNNVYFRSSQTTMLNTLYTQILCYNMSTGITSGAPSPSLYSHSVPVAGGTESEQKSKWGYLENANDCIVTETVDSPDYRGVYIEDLNIRPLQINDVILPGTRFYFNFLDTSYSYINNEFELLRAESDDQSNVLTLNTKLDNNKHTIL